MSKTATPTIRVATPEQTTTQTVQTAGIVRQEAFAHAGTWVGLARTEPGMVSGWHHHGDYDTYLYVHAGAVRMEFGAGGRESCTAVLGDFLHVPKNVVHRESNPADVESEIVVVRVGTGEPVFNVEGPAAADHGGTEVELRS
jgi:uncharacterized RmlC-like cupin family protein